jgi:hypothetical protein
MDGRDCTFCNGQQTTDNKLHYQTVCYQLPQIFYLKVFHAVFGFDIVELSVATVARYHKHFRAGSLDLIHFFSAVKNALGVISGGQGTAAAAAAELIFPAGIQINPCVHALIQYPSGFVKKAVSEQLLSFAPVIAGIVINRSLGES